MMLLDKFLPVYHFNEVHSTVIHASAGSIFKSLYELTPADIQLLRLLLEIRALPSRLVGMDYPLPGSKQPLLEQMLNNGFVFLAEETDQEFVFGAIGRFWKLFGDEPPKIAGAAEFLAFDDPDYAKVAANFYLDQRPGDSGVKVSTETRIYVPYPAARQKFALYWRIIYPGSALIRRMWLKAIKRRTEQGVTPAFQNP